MSDDPWTELTPGALGRLTLYADPARCAADLRQWAEGMHLIGPWFRAVADALEADE